MKQKLSDLQLVFLTATFIFTSSIISLPQIMVQMAGQSAWLVPLLTFPVVTVFVFIVFGKKGRESCFENLFLIRERHPLSEKIFIVFFLLFVTVVFLRDLRGLIDFVASVLLPSTPIDVLLVLSIMVISYIAMSGIEVISRMNLMHFVVLTILVLFLPFLLLNKWQMGNLLPLQTFNTNESILKAFYFSISWVGEMIFFFLIIANVQPIKKAKKSVLYGAWLGVALFLIIIILEVGVLGARIVKEAAYPSYLLSQQISITDFFERIDLVIASVWIPAIMVKTAYLLYAMNYCLSYLYKSNTNKFLFPISLTLGLLSILFFKNTMDVLNFSFYVWGSLGLMLEVIIIVLFLWVKKTAERHEKDSAVKKPIS
jgi:spore germination protein